MRRLILFVTLLVLAFSCFAAANAEGTSWDCPGCGRKGNTDNYCENCAHPSPTPAPTQIQSSVSSESAEETTTFLGPFSKNMMDANFETASDYLKEKKNYKGFWKLINEDWIHERGVTTVKSKGIFVFARDDAMVFNNKQGAQPIRSYRFFDQQGNFKLSVEIDYVGDHALAADIAERLNKEIAESTDNRDSWGYSGKEMKHFVCGDCLVTLGGVNSSQSEYGSFSDTVQKYKNLNWTIYEY